MSHEKTPRKIIEEQIHYLLKNFGFRKSGLVWNRQRQDFVDIVTVQNASYYSDAHKIFTINVGICAPELGNIIWSNFPSKKYTESECVLRFRLGDFIPDNLSYQKEDKWWDASDMTNVNIEEILNLLKVKVLPFFNKITSYQDIHDAWELQGEGIRKIKVNLIYYSLIKWKIGDVPSAIGMLRGCEGDAWGNKANEILTKIK